MDCPYTFMHDLVAGRYRLPWEDEVRPRRRHVLRLRAADARTRRNLLPERLPSARKAA